MYLISFETPLKPRLRGRIFSFEFPYDIIDLEHESITGDEGGIR